MTNMSKKKRKNLADKVTSRKGKSKPVAENPFEVRYNRQKHHVIGQKSKNHKGFPGVSKNRTMKKRKAALHLELRKESVSNKFVDKRLGEANQDLDVEDRRLARFAAQKQKAHAKSIYNLDDTEELTHFGRSLQDIEKYDDPRSDDDLEEDNLGAEFVKNAHFGGFLTKKTDSSDTTISEENKLKSRKEWLDELINKTKMKKLEKMKSKEENFQKTEELDSLWKENMGLLSGLKRTNAEEEKPKRVTQQEYDKLVKELIFQARGTPTDRLKTEEEIAKKEKERLEKLEAERLRRMNNETTTEKKQKSADYQRLSDSESGEEEDGDETKEDELPNTSTDQDDDDDENASQGSDSELESEDDDEESENEDEDAEVEDKEDGNCKNDDGIFTKDLIAEMAKIELAYTYEIPSTYKDFRCILVGHSPQNHLTILRRMVKCNHPSLDPANKKHTSCLYTHLLEYICDLGERIRHQDCPEWEKVFVLEVINSLMPVVYEIMHLARDEAEERFLVFVKRIMEDFQNLTKKKLPKFEELLLLQMIPSLYPTSDFRHPICTQVVTFILHVLYSCRPTNRCQISSSLFLLSLLRKWLEDSKRYIPEVIIYLKSLLGTGVEQSDKEPRPVLPPFKKYGDGSDVLTIKEECDRVKQARLRLTEAATEGQEIDDVFRVTAIQMTLKLLHSFLSIYKELPAARAIFQDFPKILRNLPKDKYPTWLKQTIGNVDQELKELSKVPLETLSRETQKPKTLYMYEPRFDMSYDGRKHWGKMSDAKRERKVLQMQYKKELKGAVKEVRQDAMVIADTRQRQQREKDAERKRKVKALMASLSGQEGDYRAIVKKRKR